MSDTFDKLDEIFVRFDSVEKESLRTSERQFVDVWDAIGQLKGGGLEQLFSARGAANITEIIESFSRFELMTIADELSAFSTVHELKGEDAFNEELCDMINQRIWKLLDEDEESIFLKILEELE